MIAYDYIIFRHGTSFKIFSCVTLHLSPATRILNENPDNNCVTNINYQAWNTILKFLYSLHWQLNVWVFITQTTPAPSRTQLHIGKIFATNIVNKDDFSQFILQSLLKPTIRYELKHGDMLTFGDVKCQYVVDLGEVKLSVHCKACLSELGKPTRDCKVGLYH